ncbi:GNAT family N-acetyltransferase [uncultured Roseibium sp.]|uniref:GNAT family N-acetyltransferase n=1 Tax=uncultured Roseibium sp. TaxID=1936171 RepID=UPI00260B1AF3|nr:GNAT family N-acetyltransferase [uncultured Roseibium sp.]
MTNSPFSIVEMQPMDRVAVARLVAKSWIETYVSELGPDIAARLLDQLDRDDMTGLLPGADETVFLARGRNGLRGCVTSAARHGITYLWGLYVLQEFQRKGIGRELVERAVRAHGSKNSVELTVLKSSVSARRFYTSLGFQFASDEDFEILPGISLPAEKMGAPASEVVSQDRPTY